MAYSKLDWSNIDIEQLDKTQRTHYDAMNEHKSALEASIEKAIGAVLAFSYKHGKLAVAIVERKPQRNEGVSLADLCSKLIPRRAA